MSLRAVNSCQFCVEGRENKGGKERGKGSGENEDGPASERPDRSSNPRYWRCRFRGGFGLEGR